MGGQGVCAGQRAKVFVKRWCFRRRSGERTGVCLFPPLFFVFYKLHGATASGLTLCEGCG